ncbi:hypothetical protein D3C72_199500 [compost metagenome]
MTRSNTLSPVPQLVPTAARSSNSPRAASTGQDFPTLLNAQPEPSPADPANTQPQLPVRRPDSAPTLEQLLNSRTSTLNAGKQMAQAAPAAAATAFVPGDGSTSADLLSDLIEKTGIAYLAEQATAPRAEHIRGLSLRRSGLCSDGAAEDLAPECPPQHATADELPFTGTVFWIPVESARIPPTWSRSKRRREQATSDNQRRNEADGNVDEAESS